MTSFRRVAFPLGIATICGGALLFSLSTANGQSVPPSSSTMPGSQPPGGMPGAAGVPGAAAPAGGAPSTDTGSPTFRQVIGVSPVQIGKKPLIVIGGLGDGSDTYDLQTENLYSLLREDGTPIPNVLHPLSTAKPSFILERLIILSLTGNTSTGTGNAASGAPSSPSSAPSMSGGEGATGAAQAPAGPSEAQKTVTAVRRLVDAELSRGTGRLGGSHRRKLQLLSKAIDSLEAANLVGAVVNQLSNSAGEGAAPSSGGTGNTSSQTDAREILYGRARLTARQADLVTPNLP